MRSSLSRGLWYLVPMIILAACADEAGVPTVPETTDPEAGPPPPVATVRPLNVEGYATRGEPGSGFIYGPGGEPIEIPYEIHNGVAVWEGDIVLGPASRVAKTREELLTRSEVDGPLTGAAIDGGGFRWPGGVVPYEIAGDLPNQSRVTNAISMVEIATAGVTLVPRSGEANFVRFVVGSGCSSSIGMVGGQQNINLAGGCSTGNTAHEILHALGMFHEQSRCDRDTYVVIHLENVESGKEGNFDKVCAGATDYDSYDEGSMMHYGPYAFSDNGLPTIESLRGLAHLMGQRSALGPTDISTIFTLYGFNNQPPTAVIAPLAASYPEGSSVGFDGSGSSDPDDAVINFTWDFGDGPCVSQCTDESPSHTYDDDGAYDVDLTVDDGFLSDVDAAVATITNVAPSVDAGPDDVVNEGSLWTQGGSFTDPGADTWSATVDYDDGDGAQALALAGKTFSLSHTYADNGSHTTTVTVTDDDGGVGNDDVDITVLNVAPSVDAGPDASVISGELFELTGTFSDPGVEDDPWEWEVDWGFGTNAMGSTNDQDAPIVASIQACVSGTYDVELSVTDKDGGTGTDIMSLTVPYLMIGIDIRPGGDPNPINMKAGGRIPVAILSSVDFDATSVDPSTVTLGDEVGTDTPVAMKNNGTLYASEEDVNDDGLLDLVVMFDIQQLVSNGDAAVGTTELALIGFMDDGCTHFRGTDAVVVVP